VSQLLSAPDLENLLASANILAMRGNSEVRLVVLQNQEYRLLVLNGAVQSVQYMPRPELIMFPHQQVLLSILPMLPEQARVLELGLGGGSALAHAAHFYPKQKWHSIEKSMAVIDLYLEFFAPKIPHVHHQIVCADALEWLQGNPIDQESAFDLVLCDVYAKVRRPLLRECAKQVKPGGWLLVNWLPHLHSSEQVHNFLKAVPELANWQVTTQKVAGFRNQIVRFQKPTKGN